MNDSVMTEPAMTMVEVAELLGPWWDSFGYVYMVADAKGICTCLILYSRTSARRVQIHQGGDRLWRCMWRFSPGVGVPFTDAMTEAVEVANV